MIAAAFASQGVPPVVVARITEMITSALDAAEVKDPGRRAIMTFLIDQDAGAKQIGSLIRLGEFWRIQDQSSGQKYQAGLGLGTGILIALLTGILTIGITAGGYWLAHQQPAPIAAPAKP
jgi:hypothetical protein